MTSRQLAPVLSIALAAGVSTACADEQPAPSPQRGEFRGTYGASEAGPIDAITFGDDGRYLIMPNGCRAESCAETGTYSLDAANTTLSLTDQKSEVTRTLSVEILKTVDSQSSATLLAPRNIVEPGQGGLVQSNQRLLERVESATVNGQPVQLAEAGVLRILKGGERLLVKPECTSNIASSPAWWKMCPQGTFTPLG